MDWKNKLIRDFVKKLIADHCMIADTKLDVIVWHANRNSSLLETVATSFEPSFMDMPFGAGCASTCLDGRTFFRSGLDEILLGHPKPYHPEVFQRRQWNCCFIRPVRFERNIVGATGFYSKTRFDPDTSIMRHFPIRMLDLSVLFVDIISDYELRDAHINKSLLALDIGRVAQDRFHDIYVQLYNAMPWLGSIKKISDPSSIAFKSATRAEAQIIRAAEFSKRYVEEAKYPERLSRVEVDINKIVKQVGKDLEERIKYKKSQREPAIDVRIQLTEEALVSKVDVERLYRCLANIIANAEYWVIRTESTPRRIDISTERVNSGALITIRDTGPGLLDCERAFEPGYSLRGGTGLGLAIARKVVDLHQGKILAKTEIGRWTMFEIVLPLIE